MKTILISILILLSFSCFSQLDTIPHITVVPLPQPEQIYVDLFPKGSRAPWSYRIYEKWQMQKIHHIDTIHVSYYLRSVWMRGFIPFDGDTTKLIFSGFVRGDYNPNPHTFNNDYYPTYILIDTIYSVPTLEGFEQWKELGRPR